MMNRYARSAYHPPTLKKLSVRREDAVRLGLFIGGFTSIYSLVHAVLARQAAKAQPGCQIDHGRACFYAGTLAGKWQSRMLKFNSEMPGIKHGAATTPAHDPACSPNVLSTQPIGYTKFTHVAFRRAHEQVWNCTSIGTCTECNLH